MHYTSTYPSPLGSLSLASDGQALCGLWIEGQKYFCDTLGEKTQANDEAPGIVQARAWLDEYFAGGAPAIKKLPLAPQGSAFRQAVWRILTEIPYGKTTSYKAIAKELEVKSGKRVAAVAVGGAVSHNPISIIIPCHRVIGANGSLTGYAGGLDRKRWLLEHEGLVLPSLS